jgi:NADH:ubiquinone reductase (H+-translocating)
MSAHYDQYDDGEQETAEQQEPGEQHEASERTLPRVVIVGGGFGGLRAARRLRRAPVQVTVVDRVNHHLFQPLLYQVATAELSPADITAPIRGVLRGQRNTEVLLAEVTRVDVAARRVYARSCATLGGAEKDAGAAREIALDYDYLILATGAGQSYFGHDEWAAYAPGLKTITDATALRRKILLAFEAAEQETDPERRRALLTFVVVGGGPTGVEMAGAIAELAHKALRREFRHFDPAEARILLVEATPRLLAAFPERLAEAARRKLERMGVTVRLGGAVERVDAAGVRIGAEEVAARTVIWAAGVRASPAGRWIGAATDRAGHVPVGPDLTVAGHPEIFVLGDTASARQNEEALPGLASVALQEGAYAAKVIQARVAGRPAPGPFHYFDKGSLATVGRAYAIGQIWRIGFTGLVGWLIWAGVHIMYLIGFRNRLLVMFQWAWAYLTYQRGARLIPPEERPAAVREKTPAGVS